MADGASATALTPKLPRARRWQRALAWVTGSALLLLIVSWYAVHRFDWAGPLLANGLRAVIGSGNVARLEDTVYAVEDGVNRLLKKNEPPKAYWNVPQAAAAPPPSAAPPDAGAEQPAARTFPPPNPGPALSEWSAPGDGEWLKVLDARHPDEPPRIYKTLLHPDKGRSWAEVFVFALDLPRITVLPVAGTQEPQPDNEAAKAYVREGKIPVDHQPELLAAFNGGFMTEHGGYGMKLDGVQIAKPKPRACSIAYFKDGSLKIAPWTTLSERADDMLWFRQTPECMWEGGKLHAGLEAGAGLRKWGSTVDGETVIRRSGIGLNPEGTVLFVAVTNHTSARVLADGLHHAGASDVAQLDVNWSYPKFVTFEPIGHTAVLHPVPQAPGFEYSDDEYLRKKEKRDFFYVVRKN